jgi:SpoVK/Ycf46/Vps4 family AAA+-type ATPase
MLNQIIVQTDDVRCGYQLNPALTTEAVICIEWILKLFIRFPKMRHPNALEMLGFDHHAIDNDVSPILPVLLAQARTHLDVSLHTCPFETNFSKLMQLLALSDLEQQMFRFVLISSHCSQMFEHVHLPFFMKNSTDVFGQVAWCIDANAHDLRNLFECGSALRICNLVRKVSGYHLVEQFETPQVFQGLFSQNCDIGSLLAAYSRPAAAPALKEQDFSFVQQEYLLLRRMLEKALADADIGCNFLIYGAPGTGKTQLARLLAASSAAHVQEVSAMKEDKSYDARERIHRYQVCQRMFAKTPHTVLIFDEADDVLPSAAGLRLGNVGQQKQAMNQILESNATPCFWLCNEIDNFDPAQLRRFRHILRLDVPPPHVRLTMARRVLQHIQLTEQWLEKLAIDARITPAMLAHIQQHSAGFMSDSPIENQHLLEQMINPLLMALDGKPLQIGVSRAPIRLDAYNADIDATQFLNALQPGADLKICLYGPPGTGKSSFATLLADHLKVPLIKAQASDLLCSLVGETEKAIAQVFQEATRQQAVLLIDEVDSFLTCRTRVDRHWQTTMTNELLAQLDAFEGLLVCTTNAIERIDSAALRRFDLKIKLDFLSRAQCVAQLTSLVQDFGISHHQPLTEICQQLHSLTPADFYIARRKLKQLQFGNIDVATIVATLQNEQGFKPVAKAHAVSIVH